MMATTVVMLTVSMYSVLADRRDVGADRDDMFALSRDCEG